MMRVQQIAPEYCAEVRRSANFRHLWNGMEWEFAIIIPYICFMTIICLLSIRAILISIVLGAVLTKLARMLAKKDPFMSSVYIGNFDFQDYYTAVPEVPLLVPVRKRR